VIVPEVAYPSTHDFKGQFSRWKKETPGYPLTPDGQRRWIGDFLDLCANTPAIAAVYYWSPEWCGEGMWKGMALFDPGGAARPAWSAFEKARPDRPAPKPQVFLEVRDGKAHAVPVAAAREKAAPILAAKLAKAGRVNVEYIKDITDSPLEVDGYKVMLRASLSGNLDLALQPRTEGTEVKAVIEKINPTSQSLVVFATNPEDKAVEEIVSAARQRGIEAVVHPVAADKPLKFGLGGAKADAAY
jgi:hypothetical protein